MQKSKSYLNLSTGKKALLQQKMPLSKNENSPIMAEGVRSNFFIKPKPYPKNGLYGLL